MENKEINNIENNPVKASASAEPRENKMSERERLKALTENIKSIEKSRDAKRRELQKSLAESGEAAERRIAERRASLESDREKAEKIASERAARLEYGGEYRIAQRRREQKLIKEQTERERAEAREAREKATREQIEAYRIKEAELMEERRKKAAKLFAPLDERSEDKAKGESAAEEKKTDLPAASSAEPKAESTNESAEQKQKAEAEKQGCEECRAEEAEQSSEPWAEPENKAEKKTEEMPESSSAAAKEAKTPVSSEEKEKNTKKSDTDVGISEENGKIILNIGKSEQPKTRANVTLGEDNILKIGGVALAYPKAGAPMAQRPNANKAEKPSGERQIYMLPPEESYSEEREYSDAPQYGYETYYTATAGGYVKEYEEQSESEKQLNDIEASRLIAEYEASLEGEQDDDGADALFRHNINADFADGGAYLGRDMLAFTKSELIRHLNKNHRAEVKLLKKLRASEKEQRYASDDKNALLIVEKIGIQKEIVEIASESLTYCVYASDNGKIQKYKKELLSEMENYNQLCDEYEQQTGKTLQYISPDRVDDIIAGRVTRPIPNVFYVGDHAEKPVSEDRPRYGGYETDSLWDLELSDKEYEMVVGGEKELPVTKKTKRMLEKEREFKMTAVKTAVERDLLLIGLRYEYKISQLEAERDMIYNSYTTNPKRKDKAIASIEKKINKQKRLAKRATKLERDDNTRYYSLALLLPDEEKIKEKANRERLEALRMRLDILLAEREVINEELIALYGGTDKRLSFARVNRKAATVRKKHAKAAYRSQRKIADKMKKYRAPDEMKEKALMLLNKKTEAIAAIEEAKYRLNALRPRGKAQKELYLKIKRERAKIKRINDDIHFIMKKLRRHEERALDDMQWAITLVSLAVFVIACIGAYTFFGEEIKAFFVDFYNKFIAVK